MRSPPSCYTTPSPASKSFLWALLQLPWPLGPVCSSGLPPCTGQAPAGFSHTGATFLHEWLLLFLGSQRCHSWEPRSAGATPRASQTLLSSTMTRTGTTPKRNPALDQGQAQRGCSPAARGRTLRKAWSAPQEAPAWREGRNRIIPSRAVGTVAGDSRAAASPWVPHAGSSQEQETVCPTETRGPASRTAERHLPRRHCLAEKHWSNCRLRETPCNVPTSV